MWCLKQNVRMDVKASPDLNTGMIGSEGAI